jgi:hypothetical protein
MTKPDNSRARPHSARMRFLPVHARPVLRAFFFSERAVVLVLGRAYWRSSTWRQTRLRGASADSGAASHSLAAGLVASANTAVAWQVRGPGTWPGLHGCKGRPGSGGWAACRRQQLPKSGSGPSMESASGTPTVVARKTRQSSMPVLAGERVRVRADPGLAVRARSPLTGQPGVSAITASVSGRPHRRPTGSGAQAPDRGHQAALCMGTVTGRTYPPRRPGKSCELVATGRF